MSDALQGIILSLATLAFTDAGCSEVLPLLVG